jgi:uncharacterized protein (DUF2461 family)
MPAYSAPTDYEGAETVWEEREARLEDAQKALTGDPTGIHHVCDDKRRDALRNKHYEQRM